MTIDYYAGDFGFVADWTIDPASPKTDNRGPLLAALAAIRADRGGRSGGRLWIEGSAYVSGVVDVWQNIEICGTGAGYSTRTNPAAYKPGTELVFPHGSAGFRFHSMTDEEIPPWMWATSQGSRISGIVLVGSRPVDGSEDGTVPLADGIFTSAAIDVERCFIDGFSNHGLRVEASAGVANQGNASGAMARSVTIGACGGNGVHARGGDAAVCKFERVSANGCVGHGFYDETYGNTYDTCHAAGNAAGYWPVGAQGNEGNYCDYRTAGANASVFQDCYSESGLSEIRKPALVIGGQLANRVARLTNDLGSRALNGASELGAPPEHYDENALATIRARLGGRGDGVVMGWGMPHHPTSDHSELMVELDANGQPTGWVVLRNAGAPTRDYVAYPMSGFGLDAAPRHAQGIQYGYADNRVRHIAAAAPPELADLPSGSICWNTGPGPLCWRRIDGAWEAFP